MRGAPAAVILLLAGPVAGGEVTEGTAAPLPALEGILDAGGRPADLSAPGARATLLVFWASWCRPCIHEIPVLNELQRVHGGRGLKVLGLGVREGGETLEGLRRAAQKHGAAYPIFFDSRGHAQETFGVQSVPKSALIDAGGVVRWIGPALPPDIGARIEALLEPGERRGAK